MRGTARAGWGEAAGGGRVGRGSWSVGEGSVDDIICTQDLFKIPGCDEEHCTMILREYSSRGICLVLLARGP